MTNPLRAPENYELFVYTLVNQFPSQSHPHDPTLQSTHPHHKHVPPDMKHNRIPAPEMSVNQPNLPALIREIEGLVEKT